MKKWVTPELMEMKASLTQNVAYKAGSDSYGEEGIDPSTGLIVDMGSCC